MTPKISMLSQEAKREIHARSLGILEKVGIPRLALLLQRPVDGAEDLEAGEAVVVAGDDGPGGVFDTRGGIRTASLLLRHLHASPFRLVRARVRRPGDAFTSTPGPGLW
jgi:hypothetical protein